MGSDGTSFFKTEVFRNKYVWYATGACIVLLALCYLTPVVRVALNIQTMDPADWGIAIGMGLFSLLVIQVSRKLKIIRQ